MCHDPARQQDNVIEITVIALINSGVIKQKDELSKYYYYLDHGYPIPPFLKGTMTFPAIVRVQINFFCRIHYCGWHLEVGNQDHSFMQGACRPADVGTPEETYSNSNVVNSMRATD